MMEGRDATQRLVNLMKFNKAERKVLHVGWDNPKHKHSVENQLRAALGRETGRCCWMGGWT